MLTISKPLTAAQAQNYHKKEFTAKEQNYWGRGEQIHGTWQGRLAGQFGLPEGVGEEEFSRLSQGQHPLTGEPLVKHHGSYQYEPADGKKVTSAAHRADRTRLFSAPKSVSLTALVGGDERVREAHRESVRIALTELERYVQARIGSNHPAQTTGKFIVAKFEHDTARPVAGYAAPQLHTHAVVFNVTELANGQTRALQSRSLFRFATVCHRRVPVGTDLSAGTDGIRIGIRQKWCARDQGLFPGISRCFQPAQPTNPGSSGAARFDQQGVCRDRCPFDPRPETNPDSP